MKIKANLVLHFNNYILLLFFCIIFAFLKYLPFCSCTLINYLKTFKNKCGRYGQWINNIKPINNQNIVFTSNNFKREQVDIIKAWLKIICIWFTAKTKNKLPWCSLITHEGYFPWSMTFKVIYIYSFIQPQIVCIHYMLETVLGLGIALWENKLICSFGIYNSGRLSVCVFVNSLN